MKSFLSPKHALKENGRLGVIFYMEHKAIEKAPDLKLKAIKIIFFLSKVTKRVQNPLSFFEIESPPFGTSFLPVSSIKGMPTAIL